MTPKNGAFGNLQDEQKKAFWDAYNTDAYESLATPGGTITAEAGDNPTTERNCITPKLLALMGISSGTYLGLKITAE